MHAIDGRQNDGRVAEYVVSGETTAETQSGWPGLFWEAFRCSKNAMVLVDDERRHIEVNGAYLQLLGYRRDHLIGRPIYELLPAGPIMSIREWHQTLRRKQFARSADLVCADGRCVTVEYAGHPEVVTGQRLVLVVAMRTARGGRRSHDDRVPPPLAAAVTHRELEVIELIAMGLTGPEIAQELGLAHNTVRTHVRNATAKVGARSRAHLVARSLAEGLLWRESS